MPDSSTTRTRRWRARRRAGLECYELWLPPAAVAETLIAVGRLDPAVANSHAAQTGALESAILDWCVVPSDEAEQ